MIQSNFINKNQNQIANRQNINSQKVIVQPGVKKIPYFIIEQSNQPTRPAAMSLISN